MEYSDVLQELNKLEEEYLMEMANVRGKDIKIEDLDFSIYFSSKNVVSHPIRIKVCWNREKMNNNIGYIELHGDYEYHQAKGCDYKPDSTDVATLRYFVKRYKVLFSAVWEEKLHQNNLIRYFEGDIDFKELLTRFEDISTKEYPKIQEATNLKDLENIVRDFRVYNMSD